MRVERTSNPLTPLHSKRGWAVTAERHGGSERTGGLVHSVRRCLYFARLGYPATLSRIDPPRDGKYEGDRWIPVLRFRP